MQLQPYVFFYGRCEEALEFYKKIFNGTYEAMRNTEGPAEMQEYVGPGFSDKIMHAKFSGNGVAFFASDGREAKTIDPDDGNISLALNAGEGAAADAVFNALAEGGKVTMPMQPAFWGGRFGSVNDKFGIEWLVTAQ